jgi:hypothetical protein
VKQDDKRSNSLKTLGVRQVLQTHHCLFELTQVAQGGKKKI